MSPRTPPYIYVHRWLLALTMDSHWPSWVLISKPEQPLAHHCRKQLQIRQRTSAMRKRRSVYRNRLLIFATAVS